jgi:hypothetical protein
MEHLSSAIETQYAGHLFRSRLEARWAVFFDSLGIEWKYEQEGYEVEGYRYLPDFFLPRGNVWVEVKGDPSGLRNDFQRMRKVFGCISPMPGFVEGTTGVVLLGDIPRHTGGLVAHPVLTRDKACLPLKKESSPRCTDWRLVGRSTTAKTTPVGTSNRAAANLTAPLFRWPTPTRTRAWLGLSMVKAGALRDRGPGLP